MKKMLLVALAGCGTAACQLFLPGFTVGEDAEDFTPEPDAEVEPDGLDLMDVTDVPDEVEPPPGLVWVYIPAGTYEMGCVPGDESCIDCEKPRHPVMVSAFEMTQTEITQAQYLAVTGENPSYYVECSECPVEQVDWYQAKAFCEAIGGRLPSEAEWEYAARAGTETIYICGNDPSCLENVAWYSVNSGSTQPVKGKDPNSLGLYDMSGNVWEWVEDCWHSDYTGAPITGDVWTDGADCNFGMIRGGSWYYSSGFLRVSYRGINVPGAKDEDLGLRCSREH